MIQVRRNCFETNSSSTHCLSIMKRSWYDLWKEGTLVLSIHYIWGQEDKDENLGTSIKPIINLPENYKNLKEAKLLSKAKNGDSDHEYYYENLSYGDDGFMRTSGNFDTYAPIIRAIDASKQVEENVKMLKEYIREDKKDNWYVEYLKENNKFEPFIQLIEEYGRTGEFTEEMYNWFPNYLFYKPEEYKQMLIHDDCYSPFIHIYEDVVAMGYYFHS